MHSTTITTLFTSFLLAVTPLHAYVLPKIPSSLTKRASPVDQLTAMLANPKACPTSTGECVTPADALNPILDGLSRYQILTAPEQAAVVSWMAFESVDFQYNHNVSPGRPGQGTRAMLMPNFVSQYVASMPQMNAAAAQAGSDPVKILALVQDNEHSFAAASWFYATQCSDDVKRQVKTAGKAGWSNFITNCVHTDVTEEGRLAYWQRACTQLSCPTT